MRTGTRVRVSITRGESSFGLALFRALVVAGTGTVIVVGLLSGSYSEPSGIDFDGGLVLGISALLLPSIVYLFGVSSRRSVIVCGAALFVLNVVSWGVYYISNRDGVVFSYVILTCILTLILVTVSSVRERR